MKKRIGVFCGSSLGNNPAFAVAARQLGEIIAQQGDVLVYGAGNIGLMGIVADAALNKGGHVIGIMPHHLAKYEIVHQGLQDLQLVDTMMERKTALIEQSDVFIALPGGFGTLDELSEVITWNQLKLIEKPVGILNTDGYYDHLLAFIDRAVADGLIRSEHRDSIVVDTHPEELLRKLNAFEGVEMEQWIKDIKSEK